MKHKIKLTGTTHHDYRTPADKATPVKCEECRLREIERAEYNRDIKEER